MPNYSTIDEKAYEWNMSARYIQSLCRVGKIKGAVKRAGAWSIPDGAETPAINSKGGCDSPMFVGTKSRILDCAIRLFGCKGYERVSFRDIAALAGLCPSSVYGHFKTKEELLNAIYDLYCHFAKKQQDSPEEWEKLLKTESLRVVFHHIKPHFKQNEEQKMWDITKIILQRVGIDERAKAIGETLLVKESVRTMEAVLDKAVEMGRFSLFDTHSMSVYLETVKTITLFYRMLEPESSEDFVQKVRDDEEALYEYAYNFLAEREGDDN